MSEIGKQIIAAVRSVAARNPSFIYLNPGAEYDYCVYVRNGCPSCLIGHALWDLSIIDAELEQRDYNGAWVDDLFSYLNVQLDTDEINWLGRVQAAQDSEKPWAEAVKQADDFKEEMLQNW